MFHRGYFKPHLDVYSLAQINFKALHGHGVKYLVFAAGTQNLPDGYSQHQNHEIVEEYKKIYTPDNIALMYSNATSMPPPVFYYK